MDKGFQEYILGKQKYESIKYELKKAEKLDEGALERNEQEFELILSHNLNKALQVIKNTFNKDLLLYTKGMDYDANFKQIEMQVKRAYVDIEKDINNLRNELLTISNADVEQVNIALDLISIYCLRNEFKEAKPVIKKKEEYKQVEVPDKYKIEKGVKIAPVLDTKPSISLIEKLELTIKIPFSVLFISLACMAIISILEYVGWIDKYGNIMYWITVFAGFLMTLLSACEVRDTIKVHYPYQGRYMHGALIIYGLLVYFTPNIFDLGRYVVSLNDYFNYLNWHYLKVAYVCVLTFYPIAYFVAVLFSKKASKSSGLLNSIIDFIYIPVICYLDVLPALIIMSREIPYLEIVNKYAFIYDNIYIELIIGIIFFVISLLRDIIEINKLKKKDAL